MFFSPGKLQLKLQQMKSQASILLCLITAFGLISCTNRGQRELITLNGTWKFSIDTAKTNSGLPADPGNFTREVTVPHAWNTEKGLEKFRGTCNYEREFVITSAQIRKTCRLQFDAVYHDAEIFINGVKAGEHKGSGYTRFFTDISGFIREGKNEIKVSANNYPSRESIPFLSSFDWADDGGITRNVSLVITDPVAIRNIHVNAIPKGQNGTLDISVSFLDTSLIKSSEIVLFACVDEENQSTHNTIFKGKLEGKFENGIFISKLELDNIKAWHFDSPEMYKLSLELKYKGCVKDEYSVNFGFRTITVSSGHFILNGEPVRLMGLEWMPGSSLIHGMAETSEDLEKNLIFMKNVNCVFTRFHWQQDEYVFDWCDRHGILIQEEIPFWGASTMLNDTLYAKGLMQLSEMTDAHFNHPSIISWGIGNELASHDSLNIVSLTKLYLASKETNSSRLVNYVSNALQNDIPLNGKVPADASSGFDVMMFNEYFSTWYGMSTEVISGELDKIAAAYPGRTLAISEWGVCEPVFKGGDERRSREMVKQLEIYGSKPNIAGAIYFCLNDYRTHMGEDFTYSYPQRVHGVCDINLNPKPSYLVLKSISSPVIINSIVMDGDTAIFRISGKNAIPAYTVRNYSLNCGDQKTILPEIKPGSEYTVKIKRSGNEYIITRPTGFQVLSGNLP
jgi:beta-galactosidase